jgi:protein-S-isoprenylcysteine O-methyltransferase Ste14
MNQAVILHGRQGRLFEAPRLFFLANQALAVALAGWLLSGNGYAALDRLSGLDWVAGNAGRRMLLFAFAVFYLLRLTFTLFYLLRRRMGWQEAWGNSLIMYAIHFLLDGLGGRVSTPLGPLDALALLLFLAGSTITTGSELGRHLWKRRPERQGQLYTGGLFRWARRINYFGELVSWSGYALLAHYPAAALVPAAMFSGFVFYNIPVLDAYLARHYGQAFHDFAARTKKLIPFIY